MSSFRPIAGNESFSVVENVAGAVKNLDLSEGKIDSVSAGTLNLVGVGLTDAGSQPGRGVLYRAVGYLPYGSSSIGGAAEVTVFLNKRPNVLQQSTSGIGANVNSELLLLPDNALIQKVVIINNSRDANGDLTDLTGAASGLNVGLDNAQSATLIATGGDSSLATAVTVANLNVQPVTLVTASATVGATHVIGAAGTFAASNLVTVTASTQNGVTLSVAAGEALSCGTSQVSNDPPRGLHVVVVIDYLMPGTGYVPGPVASAKWDKDASAVVP